MSRPNKNLPRQTETVLDNYNLLPFVDAHCHILGPAYFNTPFEEIKVKGQSQVFFPTEKGICFINSETDEFWILKGYNHALVVRQIAEAAKHGVDVEHFTVEVVHSGGIVFVPPKYWLNGEPMDLAGRYKRMQGLKNLSFPEKYLIPEINDPKIKKPPVLFFGVIGYGGLTELELDVNPFPLALDSKMFKTKSCLGAVPNKNNAKAIVPLMLDLGYTAFPWITNKLKNIDHLPFGIKVKTGQSPYYSPHIPYTFLSKKNIDRLIHGTSLCAAEIPGKVFPFVCYDPRRPEGQLKIEEAIKQKGFVGVKTYTRTGWMPYGNETIYPGDLGRELDKRLKRLYDFCQGEQVPILNHTSPGGFPPDRFLVLPRFYNEGKGFVPDPPWANMLSDHYSDLRKLCRTIIWDCFYSAVQNAHYIQNTVSPYSWEPVLEKWPDLHLCFGHCGGETSMIFHFDELTSLVRSTYKDQWKKVRTCSMVASGEKFSLFFPQIFVDFVKDRMKACLNELVAKKKDDDSALRGQLMDSLMEELRLKSEKRKPSDNYRPSGDSGPHDYLYPRMKRMQKDLWDIINNEIDDFTLSSTFANWVKDWAERYPLGWIEKIHELLKFPNVYADIAYLSGKDEILFSSILKKFVGLASHTPFFEKILVGTDWFICQEDGGIGVVEMWRKYRSVIEEEEGLLEQWASINPLRFLNLGKRMNDLEVFYAENNMIEALPRYWRDLRKFYDNKP